MPTSKESGRGRGRCVTPTSTDGVLQQIENFLEELRQLGISFGWCYLATNEPLKISQKI